MSKNLAQIILSDDLRNLKLCMFRGIKIQSTQQKRYFEEKFFIELCCFYERENATVKREKCSLNFPTFPCAWLSIFLESLFYRFISQHILTFPCTTLLT